MDETSPTLAMARPTQSPIPPQQQCRFLALPAEIRVLIYRELFARPGLPFPLTYSFAVPGRSREAQDFRDEVCPALPFLQTCHQIHQEASKELYSQNTFMCLEPAILISFFELIEPRNCMHLRSIALRMAPTSLTTWAEGFRELRSWAPGVRVLDLTFVDKPPALDMAIDIGQFCTGMPTWTENALGKDVDLLEEIGRMTGVRKIRLWGYFGMNWPAYLRQATGAIVKAERRFPKPLCRCGRRRAEDERPQEVEDAQGRIERFQRGTEDLWPESWTGSS